ncbi:MAG: hypothetical protein ACYDG6_06715 [Thermincolia bacterium]
MTIEKRIICNAVTGSVKEDTFTHIGPTLAEIKRQKITEIKLRAKAELDATDYKVIRHRDQVANNLTTALTSIEYQALLTSRQAVRDKSNTLETQVNAATTDTAVYAVVW